MKVVKKILITIAALVILLCLLVLTCALNPGLTGKIAGLLYPGKGQSASVVADSDAGGRTGSGAYGGMGDRGSGGAEGDDAGQGVSGTGTPEEGGSAQEADGTGLPEDGAQDGPMYADAGQNTEGMAKGVASNYVPPSRSEIVIPENVSGRNGYEQLRDVGEQIGDDEAGKLLEQLDFGNTGDGLNFDPYIYPYYAMLDDAGQHIYRQIYANANELKASFAPVESVTAGQLKNVFAAVYNDHPELFWMDTGYSCKYIVNGQCVEINLKFNRTAQNLESEKALFEAGAEKIAAQAYGSLSGYEKEKLVHDALIDSVSYDAGAEMNQSAYSTFVNGRTVCAGYARAFQYVLQKLGIACYYCTGYAGENHAWNIVALDDGYYNVDTTWDDVDGGNYDYFNKTDADYASSHIRQELSVYLPPCNGQAYRGLEQTGGDSGLRTLADLGMTEEQVIADMEGYYDDCHGRILENGKGSYTFLNVIDAALLDRWYQDYFSEGFKSAYLERAMTQIGAAVCDMTLEVEELQGDRYAITHKMSVR